MQRVGLAEELLALYRFYGQRVVLQHSADSAIGMRSALDWLVLSCLAEAEGGRADCCRGCRPVGRSGRVWIKALSREWVLARQEGDLDPDDPVLIPKGA